MKWKIYFFQTARGDYPVKEFINQQDATTYAKIIHVIDLLEIYGPRLTPPYSKKLQDKLYELRTKGKIAVRILYVMHGGTYYLLHVFKKKSQKTPTKEIKTALDRMESLI
mgnify:CR=1 FL=1